VKPSSVIPPTSAPRALDLMDLKFYVGRDHLKVKAVDRMTKAGFTVAYLCPTLGGEPVKRDIAIEFAALATSAQDLLLGAQAILMLSKSNPGVIPEGTLLLIKDAVERATLKKETVGMMSPELAAILAKAQVGEAGE
jgi:hypothetical protein